MKGLIAGAVILIATFLLIGCTSPSPDKCNPYEYGVQCKDAKNQESNTRNVERPDPPAPSKPDKPDHECPK